MPVTIELIVLMLLAYALGIGIGWGLWGTSEDPAIPSKKTEEDT